MREIYCIKCKKYKDFKKPKISYIWYITFLIPSICNKCGSEDEQILMKEESIKI